MKLGRLRLRDFRNIAAADLSFHAERVVVLGPNGQGKTNLLEAVHLLCLTRAFRTHRLSHLQREEGSAFMLEGSFDTTRGGRRQVRATQQAGGLIFELDGKQLEKRRELFGQLPLVLLSPESMDVSQGAPEARRRYLDRLLSLSSPRYLDALIRYQRLLKQRGRLLVEEGPHAHGLELWEGQMAEAAIEILSIRGSFLVELEGELRQLYRDGFSEEALPTLEHRANMDAAAGIDSLMKAWQEARLKDAERGWTALGPHRDELRVKLEGRTLRDFGSQGQHKLLMLCLALAEVRLLKRHTGEDPLLLLDDLFGMLDDGRIGRIGDAVDKGTQILISTTSRRHLEVIGGELQVIHCEKGVYHEGAAA